MVPFVHPQPSGTVAAFLGRAHGAFIGGRAHPGDGEQLTVHDPATGAVIATVREAGPSTVAEAVRSARRGFTNGRWSELLPAERERILLRFADLVERDGDFLAELETREQGKAIGIARQVGVAGSVQWMRYAAGLATKITGQTVDLSLATPPGTQATAFTRREPVGVVAGIVPWNFPTTIALWKIMPALAAGCTIVLKPSEVTPLTALRLAELAVEAGVPEDVFNVVVGRADTGRALVDSPDVAKITFTGSTRAGIEIGQAAMRRLARVALELGGKNPAIVLADADPAATAAGLALGGFFNGGQVCAAASRIYVEAPLFDRLAQAFSDIVEKMRVGSGFDPDVDVAPLASAAHRDRVAGYIDEMEQSGLPLIRGGATPEGAGYFVSPAMLLQPDPGLRIMREEVFGPVLAITQVADADEALRLANNTSYGLSASVWTRDLGQAMRVTRKLEAGLVWVNTHTPIDPALPFGGYKMSGVGREFGTHWAEAYTEEKSICIVA